MLRAIALYLGLPENYFDDKIRNGNSILRPIHYFPIDNPDSSSCGCSSRGRARRYKPDHTIDGCKRRWTSGASQRWKVDPDYSLPDQLVVNVGDMLERLTNKKLKSTIHRVVNPPRNLMNIPRYSIPFFMHPRSEMSLAALPGCVDNENPKQWEDITAGEFLDQRLREIGLKK